MIRLFGSCLLALSLVSALAGCMDDRDVVDPTYPCSSSSDDVSVEGKWQLTGTGVRDECDDARLNTSRFQLGSPALTIAQGAELASFALKNGPVIQGGSFVLSNGKVDGTCVTFKIVESGPQGSQTWSFAGAKASSNAVTGVFNSGGPGGCKGSGTFAVSIK